MESDNNNYNNENKPCWVYIEDGYTLWKGKWSSTTSDTIFGTIKVPLKENNIGTYQVDALITYDGCYNSGKKISFPVNVISTEIKSLQKRDVTYLEFTGFIGNQKIEYSISEYKADRIVGIYKSYYPNDAGTIELKPTDERQIDMGVRSKSSWCVIN